MRIKWILIGSGVLLLYLWKKKKDRQKEQAELEKAVEANEMPSAEQIDLVRLKIEDWLRSNWPFSSDEEIREAVIFMTSNLDEYKAYLEEYNDAV